MKLIFVAGPYRGNGDNRVFENIMHARTASRKLWLDGWAVFCPHLNSLFMDGSDIEPMSFLDADLIILKHCDAIFMLKGWENSFGASGELEAAMRLKLEIIYE